MGYNVNTVKCVNCDHTWVSVWPEGCLLKTIECPACRRRGVKIATLEETAFHAINNISINSIFMGRLLDGRVNVD